MHLYAPLGILAYAAFYGDMVMLQKVEFYFDKLKDNSLIFTMDGEGDNISSSVSTYKEDRVEKISENWKKQN